MAEVVVDASAMVDLLLDNELGGAVRRRLAGHAPAHVDAKRCSLRWHVCTAPAISRPRMSSPDLQTLVTAPIERHNVSDLLIGSWSRRHQLRLVDALYIQLAVSREIVLVTTDRHLQAVPAADVVVT